MSAAIRTVKVGDAEATYDSDMKMRSLKGLLGSAAGGDLDGLVEALSSFVQSWPFEGDPSNAADWDEITRTEFNDIVSAVVEDLGTLGEA